MIAKDLLKPFIYDLFKKGCDATIPNSKGECVTVEKYSGRFKLVLSKEYNAGDIPGLQAAGDTFSFLAKLAVAPYSLPPPQMTPLLKC